MQVRRPDVDDHLSEPRPILDLGYDRAPRRRLLNAVGVDECWCVQRGQNLASHIPGITPAAAVVVDVDVPAVGS